MSTASYHQLEDEPGPENCSSNDEIGYNKGNTGYNQSKYTEKQSGMSWKTKLFIGLAILVVIIVIVLSVLGGMGYLSGKSNTETKDVPCPVNSTNKAGICVCDSGYTMNGKVCEKNIPSMECPANSTKLSDGSCACKVGYVQTTALDGTKTCQLTPTVSCTSSQDIYNGQCVAKCGLGQIRTPSGCACPVGTSGVNCMVVESVGGVPVTSSNGYYVCKGNGLIWNGYKCINTNGTSCPLTASGQLVCSGERNVYWIHDSASSDPYQCYNGTDTAGGKTFGQSGSYAEPTDRCMFGLNGVTDSASCNNLKTALKC